jgi:TRAP-type C4-dicarboxylate transport system permease small subunit
LLQKAGVAAYKIYFGIGIIAVGIMAFCVIFGVIARYLFGISYTFLEEFVTTVFAFTTFWGMGICVMEDEHVIIDTFMHTLPVKIRKFIIIFNHLVVFSVLGIMLYYGTKYAQKFGSQISMGMRIPMVWMYGIIPLGSAIGMVTVAIRTVECIVAPASACSRKNGI